MEIAFSTTRQRVVVREQPLAGASCWYGFLRDQGQPQSEWLAALSADQTLSEPVRQRVLQFAREWK